MTGPYCRDCERKSEGRESVDSESRLSGIENGGATAGTELAGKLSEVQTEKNRCEPGCSGELHPSPCGWLPYLELQHREEDPYVSVDGSLVSPAGLVRGDENTHIIGKPCSLTGQVWIDGHRVAGL